MIELLFVVVYVVSNRARDLRHCLDHPREAHGRTQGHEYSDDLRLRCSHSERELDHRPQRRRRRASCHERP